MTTRSIQQCHGIAWSPHLLVGLGALLRLPPPDTEIDALLDTQLEQVDMIRKKIDSSQWVTLNLPEKEETPWKIDCLSVEPGGRAHPSNRNSEWLYRASIDFRITDGFRILHNVFLKLKYNSVFVTPPPCRLDEPEKTHEVHRRGLQWHNREEVSAKVLDYQQPFADEDKIMWLMPRVPDLRLLRDLGVRTMTRLLW
ncbi:hypothetical protein BJY00DRAFT_309260 [Aspergillus carlsbadensis]|nr:hypothetical protein BJY00DRAFT_309260 [Aspergillus carlsbadensis]